MQTLLHFGVENTSELESNKDMKEFVFEMEQTNNINVESFFMNTDGTISFIHETGVLTFAFGDGEVFCVKSTLLHRLK